MKQFILPLVLLLVSTSCFGQSRIKLVVTGYCKGPCKICGTHGITSRGTLASRNRTIAADWRYYPPGTIILLHGHKYVVEDRGSAVNGKYHIDRCFSTHREAKNWGRQKVLVAIIPPKKMIKSKIAKSKRRPHL